MKKLDRLQKILSQAGIASRRASERLMLEGRVTVNGTTVRELGTKADPARDDIRVDGRRIRFPERQLYLLLNKPRGYVTTRSDPQRRPTVLDLVGVREYVYPVGRLDFDSEGLLLLTNDGDLAARLTHPSHAVERVYEARVLGVPDEHDLTRLRNGLVIEGRKTGPADVQLVSPHPSARVSARGQRPQLSRARTGERGERASSHRGLPPRGGGTSRASKNVERRGDHEKSVRRRQDTATLLITIREGRNRQVRKMLEATGHPVDYLRRIAIGPIRDDRLKVGHWRELTPTEIERLRKAASH